MNVFKKILAIISVSLLFFACSENAPTELIREDLNIEDNFEVEILSPEPSQFYYATGYDSTGVASTNIRFESFIGVNRITDQKNNTSNVRSIGTAVFFDTSKAIYTPNQRLLGYTTRFLGRVIFNGDSANLLPYRKRFLHGGIVRDTTFGYFYLLSKRGNSGSGHGGGGTLSGTVNVDVQLLNVTVAEYLVEVPKDINGNVSVIGSRLRGDLALECTWDLPANRSDKIDIIIGGVLKQNNDVFPLFRINTLDDGLFTIPVYLLRRISFDKFSDLVISLIRVNQNASNHNILGSTNIVGQNIHNIRIKIN